MSSAAAAAASSTSSAAGSKRKQAASSGSSEKVPGVFRKDDRVRRTAVSGLVPVGTLGTILGGDMYGGYNVRWDGQPNLAVDGWDANNMEHHHEDELGDVCAKKARGPRKGPVKSSTGAENAPVNTRVQLIRDWGEDLARGATGVVTSRPCPCHRQVLFDGKVTSISVDDTFLGPIPEEDLPPSSSSSSAAAAAVSALDDPANDTPLSDDQITWLEVPQWQYAPFEIVQNDIKCGIKISKTDVARLGGDFLAIALENAQRDGESRLIIKDKSCASIMVMHAVFELACVAWPRDDGPLVAIETFRDTVDVLHAANIFGLYHKNAFAFTRSELLRDDCDIPLVELWEIGCKYFWKELKKKVAKKLQNTETPLPKHIMDRCAPHWRKPCTSTLGEACKCYACMS